MKRLSLFLLLAIAGCQPQTEKKDIMNYFQKNFSEVSSIEVLNVSPVDSMFTPFMDYNSIAMLYYDYTTNINKAISEAYRIADLPYYEGKLKDVCSIIDTALKENNELNFWEKFRIARESEKMPFNPICPKNRIGFMADIKIEGKLETVYFYYNTSEKTIGHSSIDNQKRLMDILDARAAYQKARAELMSL